MVCKKNVLKARCCII